MNQHEDQLSAISDIKNMMERSSKFLSLNGFSGVFAGTFALVGAAAAYLYMGERSSNYYESFQSNSTSFDFSYLQFFIIDAFLVLFFSLTVSTWLSVRKAKKNGLKIWDNTGKRVVINMMVPLVTGGIFCLIMIYHHYLGFVAPAMLIFYGLALFTSSKYTFEEVRVLGILEISLGLLAAFFIANGLLFWTLGFGVLHIIYGILMYLKYDCKPAVKK